MGNSAVILAGVGDRPRTRDDSLFSEVQARGPKSECKVRASSRFWEAIECAIETILENRNMKGDA